jgi:hypothetical protein
MTRIVPIFIATCYVCVTALAEDVPFHRLGYAFTQSNINVVWKASTRNLPRAVWTYQAVPSDVSSTVISNLVALGGFTARDRKETPNNPHLISYANATKKKWLLINPAWAFVDYGDPDANDFHITNGVPDRRQAFKMAGVWLSKLGIDDRQLFPNPNGAGVKFYGGPDTVWLYPRGGGPAYATNIHAYGVIFYRALDGIEFSGGCARGGGQIDFGHHAGISKILVSWRNYQRDKLYPTTTRKGLLEEIRNGKAVWYSTNADWIDWPSVRKITITKITPYYYSEAYDENDKPQNAAYPFAEMEAVAYTGTTNLAFNFDCPIIDETKAAEGKSK